MRTFYLISLVYFITISAFAQPEADAAFDKILKEFTLHEDGSMDFHYYKKVNLYTHFSFNRLYGETFIVYNPAFQKLTINKAFTTQSNGNIVHSPPNAFNEVLPGFAQDAPYFSQLREMVVTHTGLEVNSVIELDYNISSQAGYFPALMGNEVIAEASPVREEIIVIKIPKHKELYYKVFNIRTAPDESEEKDMKIYTFTFRGISEGSHENFLPENSSHLPRLVFSTEKMEGLYKYLVAHPAFQYKTSDDAKKFVSSLKEKSENDLQLIFGLQKAVATEMNNWNIPFEHTGYLPRVPADTWAANGGTPFEKAILLAGLYREAGIHAEPVMMFPEQFYDAQTGCLPLVTDFLVQVNPRETEQQYISPVTASEQNLIYRLDGCIAVALNPDKPLSEISFSESPGNKAVLSGELLLDDSLRISGKLKAELSGRINPYYTIAQNGESVKNFLSGSLSKQDVKDFELINSAQIRSTIDFTVEKKEALVRMGEYLQLDLPELNKGLPAWHMNYLYSKRETPLEVPFTLFEKYEIDISLPSGIQWIGKPVSQSVDAGFGSLIIEIDRSDKGIKVSKSLEIRKRIIEVSEYPEFKRMIDLFHAGNSKSIMLKMTGTD
ncbi:MAG: DUF3857 domain-containing protein [Bacteroidales bacterium]|nr:DUF3857 domain-containing protein [Bacteroidales bacterium]